MRQHLNLPRTRDRFAEQSQPIAGYALEEILNRAKLVHLRDRFDLKQTPATTVALRQSDQHLRAQSPGKKVKGGMEPMEFFMDLRLAAPVVFSHGGFRYFSCIELHVLGRHPGRRLFSMLLANQYRTLAHQLKLGSIHVSLSKPASRTTQRIVANFSGNT
ncbi:hypothetical protein [Ferrimonas marina]|uniref:Uncharacterized protein n=1 Tax=Ferrimonas marina TaxID=299255 RepID=A0A1M5TYQ9_9GAMM|nr:hypothetical protein [Ferrimonas marina]SHH55523.1 hypothetical protein SAMN02745129_2321 [Ferrimonas marina]